MFAASSPQRAAICALVYQDQGRGESLGGTDAPAIDAEVIECL